MLEKLTAARRVDPGGSSASNCATVDGDGCASPNARSAVRRAAAREGLATNLLTEDKIDDARTMVVAVPFVGFTIGHLGAASIQVLIVPCDEGLHLRSRLEWLGMSDNRLGERGNFGPVRPAFCIPKH